MVVWAAEPSGPRKQGLSREKVRAVLKQGGKVELAEILRLRMRHFTDGLVFGSREFVEEVCEEFRDRFGQKRKSGARKVVNAGESLSAFATLRDLRKDAVG